MSDSDYNTLKTICDVVLRDQIQTIGMQVNKTIQYIEY